MTPSDHRAKGNTPLWACLALACLALYWIADSASRIEKDHAGAWHHYDYLVEGFLKGHTYLSVDPAAELLKLDDPYDPQKNGPWRLWDASLFKGRYYLYFGPTPVLLLLPWRVVFGHPLPQRLAVAFFAIAAAGALAALLARLRRTHFPELSAPRAGLALVALCAAAWLPVTLRRPDVWELPVVAACACLWWALYCLWRCLEQGRTRWAIAVGLFAGLAMGARPTFVLAAAVLVLFQAAGPARLRSLAWTAAIVTCAGLLLLAYNVARFGHPLDFGQAYQLWGADERNVRHFSLGYAAHNAWLYFLSVPALSPYFPFVLAVPPGGEPAGYLGVDEIHGGLVGVPAQFACLAALLWAWRSRGEHSRRPLVLAVAASLACFALGAGVILCFAGAVTRYATEVFAGCTFASAVGLAALLSGDRRSSRGRLARILAIIACAWTIAFSLLASAENRVLMRRTNPEVYGALARVLDYPSLWYARSKGVPYGPIAIAARFRAYRGQEACVLVSSGRAGMLNELIAERIDADHVRLVLVENGLSGVVASPVVAIEQGMVVARVEAPWLYPPREHPWWDTIADPALRGELEQRFSITVKGSCNAARSRLYFDPTGLQPRVQTDPASQGWVEAFERLAPPAR